MFSKQKLFTTSAYLHHLFSFPAGDSIPFVIQPAGPPPDYVSPELVHIIQANAPDHLDLVDPTTARTFARPNGHPIRTSVDMAFGSVATAPRPQQITRARQANSPVRVGAAMANDGNGRRTGDVVGKQEMRHEGGLNGRSERAAKVEALLAKIQERNSRIAVRKAATEEELGAKQGLLRRGSPQRGSSAVASQSRVGAQSPDRVWGVHGNIRDDEGVSDRRASAEGRSRSAPHQRPVSRGPMVRKMRRSSDDSELGGRIAMDGVRASVLEKVAGRLQRKSRASVKEATALPRERKAAWSEQASGKLKPKRKFAGTRARPAGVNILEPLDLQRPATVTGVLEASGNVPGAVLSAGVKSAVRLTEFGQSITSPTLSGWSQDESGAEQSWLYSASGHGLRVNAGAEPADGLDAQNAAPKQGLASLAKGENEGPVLSGVGERPALYPGLSDIRERKQGLEEGGQLASPLVQTFALGVGSSAVGLELDGARWGVAESAKPAPLDGPLVNGEIPSVLALANAETTVGIALSSIEEKAREQVRSALAKRPQSAPSVKRPTQNSKPQVGAVPHPIFGARSHPFLRAPPPKRPFTPPPQAGVNRPPGERRKSTGGADLPGGKRPPSAQSRLGGEEGQLEEGKRKSRLSGGRLDEVGGILNP